MAKKQDFKMACSREESHFMEAGSFSKAAKVVLGRIIHKTAYQHYGRLDRILAKIVQKRWHLSKCSSSKMNDLQEPVKFSGKTNILDRTYITCFGHCLSENAAMWGLYGKSDPFALRVTIPGGILEKWMKSIEIVASPKQTKKEKAVGKLDAKGENDKPLAARNIQSAAFRDVLYASVAGKEERDEYDIRRGNVVSWEKAFYGLRNEECVLDGQYAGFIKDCEWWYERESRLCVSLVKESDDDFISVAVPFEVISAMRFTFSPWLKRSDEKRVRQILEAALKGAGVDVDNIKISRFRRSTLQGALNFK